MHPPSIYSFVTSKKAIPIAIIVIIILAILFYGLETQSPQLITQSLISPTPISITWETYKDAKSSYTMQAPQQWQSNYAANLNIKSFIYTENGKEYSFNVFPPSNVTPELSLLPAGDTIKKQIISISGKKFEETTLLSKGIPYKIFVISKDGSFSYYSFVINLPPTNTQRYVDMFNEIIKSVVIKREL